MWAAKQRVATIHLRRGEQRQISLRLQLDTAGDVKYYRATGVLNSVLD
jgi:aconitase A